MTAILEISDNAGLNRSVTVGFTGHKQAQEFMSQYTYQGGSLIFNIDYVDFNNKRSVYNVKNSHNLFLLIYAILYDDYSMYRSDTNDKGKYTWVNAITQNNKGRFLLSDKFEYPNRQAIWK